MSGKNINFKFETQSPPLIGGLVRWYGWDIVNRQRNFFFEFFIDSQELRAAGGEARVGGDMSYPAVGMLIFASCLDVVIPTGSHLFNSPRPVLTLGSGVILRRGIP